MKKILYILLFISTGANAQSYDSLYNVETEALRIELEKNAGDNAKINAINAKQESAFKKQSEAQEKALLADNEAIQKRTKFIVDSTEQATKNYLDSLFKAVDAEIKAIEDSIIGKQDVVVVIVDTVEDEKTLYEIHHKYIETTYPEFGEAYLIYKTDAVKIAKYRGVLSSDMTKLSKYFDLKSSGRESEKVQRIIDLLNK